MLSVSDVVAALDEFAPRELAEDWDNVGLLIGDRRASVAKIMTCLTLTPDVAEEAVQSNTHLIVSHHPVLFRAVKRLTTDDAQGAMLLKLIAAGVAVHSPHTRFDSAADGINQQLAELLSLEDIAPLKPLPPSPEVQVVTFVPTTHLQVVQEAVWQAGAGQIGEYSQCSFASNGTGTFRGGENSHPTVGHPGQFESVAELRLEVVCPANRLTKVLKSLRAAHPYEEPAVDIYPRQPLPPGTGFIRDNGGVLTIGSGRFGTLSQPMPLNELAGLVKKQLRISGLHRVGDPNQTVWKVGIACGAAATFLDEARRLGCDAFLTGEARFHDCLHARELGVGMLLPGHYATERPGVENLALWLGQKFPEITVTASQSETDPLAWV